jgi:hypothetical protein
MALPLHQPSNVPDPEGDLAMLEKAIVEPLKENLVVKKLAQHIAKVWDKNQRDNKQVRIDMIASLRRSRGEYDMAKLTAIRAFKGTEAYIRTSENKARSADSWIKDIYRGDTDLPWVLEPTAIPDLPDETLEQIKMQAQSQASVIEAQLAQAQMMQNPELPPAVDPTEVAELMTQYYEQMLDREKEEMAKSAKDRCKRAAQLIRDQNQECGWNDAFKEFLYYFIRVKAGIIKGPVLTKKKKQKWVPSADGKFTLETEEVLVNDVYCVSPFNFYPSKGMRVINDGDVLELHELSKNAISSMIGVPGYKEEEVRAVIAKFSKGDIKAKWFTIDDEMMVKQVTKEKNYQYASSPTTQSSTDLGSNTIWAQEFWGSVSGAMLIEWGAEGNIDPEQEYQANCWKIGDHVIKAVINPDNLGRKPYHISSWAKNPAWIWGEGLIEFAGPIEDAINAITRALINNIAIASGPMAEIDGDRVDVKIPIYPWRQIVSTSMQMKNEGAAVTYYQPQMHAQELISAWEFFSKVLDEMTVPAYAQGASQAGVTAGTATVFTQLLAAASRSIKAVVANIDDDVITPYIQMCYDNAMKFSTDETIKGDARVVAKGVAGLLVKEQSAQRKVEYLQAVTNPAYQQVLGAKNIGSILAQIAKSNDITLPDMDKLEGNDTAEMQLQTMINALAGVQETPMQEQGQISAGGGAPTKPQGLNPDGSKAGVNNG